LENNERVEKNLEAEMRTLRITKGSTSLRRLIDRKYVGRKDKRDWI